MRFLSFLGILCVLFSLSSFASSPSIDDLINHIRKGEVDTVVNLLDKFPINVDGSDRINISSPLIEAALMDDEVMVKKLIFRGANPNKQNREGISPLHIASKRGGVGIVSALLRNGAEVDIQDKYKWTPLMKAISHKRKDTVVLLLKSGADVTIKNNNGDFALIHAINTEDSDIIDTVFLCDENIVKNLDHIIRTAKQKSKSIRLKTKELLEGCIK